MDAWRYSTRTTPEGSGEGASEGDTMKATPLQHLALSIRSGEYDHKLQYVADVVWREIKDRREEIGYDMAKSLNIGDHVEVTGHIKPRYMIGVRGTISEIVGRKVTVELDQHIRRATRDRMRTIGTIVVMANSVEVVK